MKLIIFLIFLQINVTQENESPPESHSYNDTLDINLKGTNTIVYHKTEYKGIYFPYYYSYSSRNNFLHMSAEGSYKGYEIEGEIREPYSRFDEDIAYIGIKGENLEIKGGNTNFSLQGNPYITAGFKGRGVYLKFIKNDYFGENLTSFPQGEFIFERIYGNGTQGPYRLKESPVLRGSEKVRIIKEGKVKELIRGKDYRIDYVLGEIRFESIIYEDEIIEIEYQKKKEGEGITGIRAGFKEKGIIKSFGISYLRTSGGLNNKKNIYGLDINLSPFENSELSFVCAGDNFKESIYGVKGGYSSERFKVLSGFERQSGNYRIYGEGENFARRNFYIETLLSPFGNLNLFYKFKNFSDIKGKNREYSVGVNNKWKNFEAEADYAELNNFYYDSSEAYTAIKRGYSLKLSESIFIGKFTQSVGIYEGENLKAGILKGGWREYIFAYQTRNFKRLKGDFEIKIYNQNKKYRTEGFLNINYFPFKFLTGNLRIEGRRDFDRKSNFIFKKGFLFKMRNINDNLEIKREERIPYGLNEKRIFYVLRNRFNFKNKKLNFSYLKFYERGEEISLINEDNIRAGYKFNNRFTLLTFYQIKKRKRNINQRFDYFYFEGRRIEFRENWRKDMRGTSYFVFKKERGEYKGVNSYQREIKVKVFSQNISFQRENVFMKIKGILSDSLYRDTLKIKLMSFGTELTAERGLKYLKIGGGFGVFYKRGINSVLWEEEEKFLTLKPIFRAGVSLKNFNLNLFLTEERSIGKNIYAVRNYGFDLNLIIDPLIFSFNYENNEDLKMRSYKKNYTLTLSLKI